jgi:hypothetical protein
MGRFGSTRVIQTTIVVLTSKSVPGLLRKNKPCVRTTSAITNSVSKDSMNQPVRNSSGEARKINNSIPTAWLGLCWLLASSVNVY